MRKMKKSNPVPASEDVSGQGIAVMNMQNLSDIEKVSENQNINRCFETSTLSVEESPVGSMVDAGESIVAYNKVPTTN